MTAFFLATPLLFAIDKQCSAWLITSTEIARSNGERKQHHAEFRSLPSFLTEAYRLLNKQTGRLLVVIPCEGGLGYSLGRRIMSKRIFERRYNLSYEPFIAAEHVNKAHEIPKELKRLFAPENTCFFPLRVPSVQLNLCIGLTLKPRPLG